MLRQTVRHLEADALAMQGNYDDLLSTVQKLLQDVQAANATKVHTSSRVACNPGSVFCDVGQEGCCQLQLSRVCRSLWMRLFDCLQTFDIIRVSFYAL